jgi:hypothetical protein
MKATRYWRIQFYKDDPGTPEWRLGGAIIAGNTATEATEATRALFEKEGIYLNTSNAYLEESFPYNKIDLYNAKEEAILGANGEPIK